MSTRKKSRDISSRRRQKQEKGRVPWSYISLVVVLVIVIGALVYVNFKSPVSTYTSIDTAQFPFPCLSSEQLAIHLHPWLRIIIDGKNVTIPTAVGIANPVIQNGIASSGSCFEPMHTHDSSGIIHIESATDINYTLGDFFDIWNVTYGSVSFNGTSHPVVFNSTDILGYKADAAHKVVLLVDGTPNQLYGSLVLNYYDYCNSTNSVTPTSPCYATAQGNPVFNGQTSPYGTGHTVVIEYVSTSG
ncbi:MAG: hypothetical protein M1368_01170 [Thaumarchaeota archaeon]|nr:hypothetical protein [Nitrososphaerota archaeon]MDG6907164.1 hypothetical protein [Nitrososphaerota archaeon]